jgi:hypothetical protein
MQDQELADNECSGALWMDALPSMVTPSLDAFHTCTYAMVLELHVSCVSNV